MSGYKLKELSDLSGVPITTLALELTKVLASSDSTTAASVWLGLASFMCDQADPGEGQAALKRLLNSNSAKLASNVTDAEWRGGFTLSTIQQKSPPDWYGGCSAPLTLQTGGKQDIA